MASPVRMSAATLAACFWPALPGSARDTGSARDNDPQPDLAAFEAAHRAYLRDGALQLTRPETEETRLTPLPPPDWLQALGRFLDSLGPVFQVIFWVAVVLLAAWIAWFLFGEAIRIRLRWHKNAKVKAEDNVLADIRPDARRALSLLGEADALARAGRFAEAVHLLLLRSIEDIQERLDGGVAASLTAREIAGLSHLPERAKHALRPIIDIVEQSFFGGRPVDAGGWQCARDSYEAFAFGEAWA